MYTKVECYFKKWVEVFSFMYLVSVDLMDRSIIIKKKTDSNFCGHFLFSSFISIPVLSSIPNILDLQSYYNYVIVPLIIGNCKPNVKFAYVKQRKTFKVRIP